MIQIRCDIEAFKKVFTDAEKEQIPYATSRSLNITAKEAQAALQGAMRQNFIIRRPWVLQEGVKIKHFSDKRDNPMYTRIEVGEKADFLEKFETGGTKTPRSSANLAVPIAARPSKSAVVPPHLWIKSLQLHPVGKTVRGNEHTFVMQTRSGRKGIFQRTGPGKRDYVLLYWLTPSVPIPPALHFEETIRRVVEERWPKNFEQFFAEAMRTAR